MKKILLMSLVLFAFSTACFASEPQVTETHYCPNSKYLTASILYHTDHPTVDFVRNVTVKLNDELIIVQDHYRQLDPDRVDVAFRIPNTKDGDVLKITAFCNATGDIIVGTGSVVVGPCDHPCEHEEGEDKQ